MVENMSRFFEVNVNKYVADKNFFIYRPASLNNPKNHAVMFIQENTIRYSDALLRCNDCLVFWPEKVDVPRNIQNRHAIKLCNNTHKEFARFFVDNNITHLPEVDDVNVVNGAYVAKSAIIGKGCSIFSGAYIGGEVEIGDNCYIGSGVKLVGRVLIGNNVVIRENSVLGADGLTTDRNEQGKALTIPQFGGIIIEDDVQIGALTVIARGAIDNTVIKRGAKIDSSSFISHNVQIGEDTFIVGETIMFGSSSTGEKVLISGNSAISNGRRIGSGAIVGVGSTVVFDVKNDQIVKGNPAR